MEVQNGNQPRNGTKQKKTNRGDKNKMVKNITTYNDEVEWVIG